MFIYVLSYSFVPQCVKALVFYDASLKKIQINKTNEFGDTPLHLAAKWGYGKYLCCMKNITVS